MVIPSYQDGKTDEYFNLNEEDESDPVDTRKAGTYLVWLITINEYEIYRY